MTMNRSDMKQILRDATRGADTKRPISMGDLSHAISKSTMLNKSDAQQLIFDMNGEGLLDILHGRHDSMSVSIH